MRLSRATLRQSGASGGSPIRSATSGAIAAAVAAPRSTRSSRARIAGRNAGVRPQAVRRSGLSRPKKDLSATVTRTPSSPTSLRKRGAMSVYPVSRLRDANADQLVEPICHAILPDIFCRPMVREYAVAVQIGFGTVLRQRALDLVRDIA